MFIVILCAVGSFAKWSRLRRCVMLGNDSHVLEYNVTFTWSAINLLKRSIFNVILMRIERWLYWEDADSRLRKFLRDLQVKGVLVIELRNNKYYFLKSIDFFCTFSNL